MAVSPGGRLSEVQHQARQTPPTWVRLRYRLGIPPPCQWRPWVAREVQGPEWTSRHKRRVQTWRRRQRWLLPVLGVYMVALVLIAGLKPAFELLPGLLGGALGAITSGFAARKRLRKSDDHLLASAQSSDLRWHGVLPDGTAAADLDRLTTIAWLPDWVLTALAVMELTALAAVPMGLLALLLVLV